MTHELRRNLRRIVAFALWISVATCLALVNLSIELKLALALVLGPLVATVQGQDRKVWRDRQSDHVKFLGPYGWLLAAGCVPVILVAGGITLMLVRLTDLHVVGLSALLMGVAALTYGIVRSVRVEKHLSSGPGDE